MKRQRLEFDPRIAPRRNRTFVVGCGLAIIVLGAWITLAVLTWKALP